jgi:hypothetical protein
MDRPSHSLFCNDLKEYLERYIDVARRYRRCCVAVLLRRMLRKEGRKRYHAPYSKYLKKLFSRYMFGRGTYIVPLEDAEKITTDIDHLCEALKNKKHEPSQQPKEKMVLISLHLPKKMLEDADKYAETTGTTRSAVIRKAVEEMLKKYRNLNVSANTC